MDINLKVPDCEISQRAEALSKRIKKDVHIATDVAGKAVGEPTTSPMSAAQDCIAKDGRGYDTYRKGKHVNFTGHERCQEMVRRGHPV